MSIRQYYAVMCIIFLLRQIITMLALISRLPNEVVNNTLSTSARAADEWQALLEEKGYDRP